MSATIGQNGRRYERAFDWDAARILRERGWSYREIAANFGVSLTAVERIFNPELAQKMSERSAQRLRDRREPCKGGCGKLVWMHQKNRTGLCPACFGKQVTTTVRPDTLLCTHCGEWKPDEDFPHARNRKARRGRHGSCRKCGTIVKREWRERTGRTW